tara:strand:- start:650 stop:895 length:246 start_codon:yes stop_codon:yes gene_type:complete
MQQPCKVRVVQVVTNVSLGGMVHNKEVMRRNGEEGETRIKTSIRVRKETTKERISQHRRIYRLKLNQWERVKRLDQETPCV